MAIMEKVVEFRIGGMPDHGDVKAYINNDGYFVVEQGSDSIWLDNAGAQLLRDAIAELMPS